MENSKLDNKTIKNENIEEEIVVENSTSTEHEKSWGNTLINPFFLLAIIVIILIAFLYSLLGKDRISKSENKPVFDVLTVSDDSKKIPDQLESFFELGDWKEDIEAIFFYQMYDKSGEIWAMETNGEKFKLLGQKDENERPNIVAINWSPDGKKFAFLADFVNQRNKKSGMYIYDSQQQKIVSFRTSSNLVPREAPSSTTYRSWSNDSRYFAYIDAVSNSNSPILIYDTQENTYINALTASGENTKGPLFWNDQYDLYFISFTPIKYCNSPGQCEIREQSMKEAIFSVQKYNLVNRETEIVYSKKLTNGGLDAFLLNKEKEEIFFHGRQNSPTDLGYDKIPLYKLDLNSEQISEYATNISLSGGMQLSPNNKFIAVTSEFGMFPETKIYSIPDFKLIFETGDNSDIISFMDWLNSETIIISKDDMIYTRNLNTGKGDVYFQERTIMSIRPKTNSRIDN
ncbi:hypothetical protein KKD03_02025 [Patescibacteria group bacterium]|nr:hypothetical protein [Patescibacteria group bacterium]